MTTEKRAVQICKELSISFKTLSKYGDILGVPISSISGKIPLQVEPWIHRVHFQGYDEKMPKAPIKKQAPVKIKKPLPFAFS